MKEFFALSVDELNEKIADYEAEIFNAEENFKKQVTKLQQFYRLLIEDKGAILSTIKQSGISSLLVVQSIKAKTKAKKSDATEKCDSCQVHL